MLQEDGDEPFVTTSLPDEPETQTRLLAGGRRLARQLFEGGRRRFEQVASPVEHPHVDEPGERVQHAIPAVRLHGSLEEARRIGAIAIQRQNPAGGGELGRPDDVELQDVGIAGPGVQPLNVKLVTLVGRVRGLASNDAHVRVLGHEAVELKAQQLRLGADGAGRKGDDGAGRLRIPAARGEREGCQRGDGEAPSARCGAAGAEHRRVACDLNRCLDPIPPRWSPSGRRRSSVRTTSSAEAGCA